MYNLIRFRKITCTSPMIQGSTKFSREKKWGLFVVLSLIWVVNLVHSWRFNNFLFWHYCLLCTNRNPWYISPPSYKKGRERTYKKGKSSSVLFMLGRAFNIDKKRQRKDVKKRQILLFILCLEELSILIGIVFSCTIISLWGSFPLKFGTPRARFLVFDSLEPLCSFILN